MVTVNDTPTGLVIVSHKETELGIKLNCGVTKITDADNSLNVYVLAVNVLEPKSCIGITVAICGIAVECPKTGVSEVVDITHCGTVISLVTHSGEHSSCPDGITDINAEM